MRVFLSKTLVVLLVVLGGVGSVRAQSLADLAKKEAERRKSVQGTSRVYTNNDLKPVPEPPPDPSATASDASGAPSDTPAPGADAVAAGADAASATDDAASADAGKAGDAASKKTVKDQKYWSERMRALRDELDHNQSFVAALQSRLNALDTDFVNRDDPAQRAMIATERDKTRAELARMHKAVAQGVTKIADAEEEARRANVPPGWLR